jgi:predicted restriction endonuclease
MPDYYSRTENKFRRYELTRIFKMSIQNFIKHFYISEMMSFDEIEEMLANKYNLKITPKTLSRWARSTGLKIRNKKEAFQLAIKKNRMTYEHQRKTIRIKRSVLAPKTRFEVLKRDNFKCQLCGKGVKEGAILEAGHLIAVKDGGTNELTNLQTECFECNHGH